jgi:hypothetical protein
MMYVENPLRDLHEAMAHAQYEGFSSIAYEARDFEAIRNAKTTEERAAAMHATTPAVRRPYWHDFCVYAMFPQTWGSTALGHGGMGGAAMTTAYTIVLECYATREFLVYFGGQICYTVNRDSANFDIFIEDCKNHKLVSKRDSAKYD